MSLQGEVARHQLVGRVEVALGLGQAAEAPMAPPHLDVPGHHRVPARRSHAHGGRPAHPGLPALLGEDLEAAQREELAPIPRGGDAQPQ